ncbi:MAG: 4-(cytidine 5'-diphospho)-2-C-methyl-D-erythritol kinase [Cytophagaceae bacterium]|nr:4-(cytidine 5'-diphospho)-2-C-methyl-D-erythritol kinase [Cytophagaceae bacterium]MDW8455320.1 4-(cytidine 5'-diphospho)-2-C-methyl-D-erythritol kinase [Cytophagaceae bacterium]
MIAFPNAKINLGLNIVSKREDGYHNIETCFYPILWSDALEILKSDTFSFESRGLPIAGSIDNNLCVRAYKLMQEKYDLPPVRILLYKNIPMGAGLGGGSSDATATICLLNELFELNLKKDDLTQLASSLGSDCAFFVHNKPSIAYGRGNIMKEINLSLRGKHIIVVYPDVHVSTGNAYAQTVPAKPTVKIEDILLAQPIRNWKDKLINDFEKTVFAKHPLLSEIKQMLYMHGAEYAAMSGSGSAIFGIFDSKPNPASIKGSPQWKTYISVLP